MKNSDFELAKVCAWLKKNAKTMHVKLSGSFTLEERVGCPIGSHKWDKGISRGNGTRIFSCHCGASYITKE